MVMNLDKCIGCHTCSVTCKNVWTNRRGAEYMWFNDVETKPGVGYPKRWEDQEKWRGGWELDRKGKLRLKARRQAPEAANIFYNPDLPLMDDYYEPWTYDYEHLTNAPPLASTSRSPADLAGLGQAARPAVGAELGGRPRRRARARARRPEPARRRRGAGAARVRAGVHVLPAADLRALPQPVLRRELPVGRDVQARGGRHRARRPGGVPQLALLRQRLPVQEGLLQLGHRQGREVHASAIRGIEAGPADRVLGDLRRPDPLHGRRPLRRRSRRGGRLGAGREGPAGRAARHLPRPGRPRGAGAGAPRRDRRRLARAARRSPVYALAVSTGSRCRCTPSTGRCRWSGTCRRSRR